MDELTRELTHLGLTAKESAVYLAAMELGPSVAQDISKKAKVNRATTYVMIDSLKGRGLMSSFTKGNKKYFSAESPDRLLSMIRLQRQELEGKEAEFEQMLPKLLALYNVEGAKPQIRFLEGMEGIKTIRAEAHKLKGEALEIVPLDDAYDFVTRGHQVSHSEHYKAVRDESLKARALLVVKDKKKLEVATKGMKNIEVRVIPYDLFPIHGEITIREDRVMMFSYKSALVSIVITSQELADTIRALFELAWKGAEKYPKMKS